MGSEVQIVTHGTDGLTRVASTLPQTDTPAQVPADGGAHVTQAAGTDYLGFVRRLNARGDSVDVILLEPLAEVYAPYRELRDAMLLIDGVALALAALVGAVLGRSATRPIGELVRAAQRIEKGQYQTAVRVTGGEEFRALASTLNTMQQHIAAREADITYQAEHDPLTGLPNRAYARASSERWPRPQAMPPALG